MFRCPYCEKKLKTKSSLNRHCREACKKKKAWKPTSEILFVQSPAGDSYVSAIVNPEYLLPGSTSAAAIDSAICYNNENLGLLSPLQSPPLLKRSCESMDMFSADPRVLTFGGTTLLNANADSSDDNFLDVACRQRHGFQG